MINLSISSSPCPKTPRLERYLDGELSAQERRAVEAHLDACAECCEHLRALQDLRQALQTNVVPWAQLSSDGEFWEGLAPRLVPRRPADAPGWAAPFWTPFGLVVSNAAMQGATFVVSLVVLLHRWGLLPASWGSTMSRAGQFLVGPLVWQAGLSASSVLGGFLPETWALIGRTGYILFAAATLGLTLILSGMYMAWLLRWLRQADRINHYGEAS